MALVVKSIKLPKRVRLDYVEQGDPSGIPVIMLHGVTDSWHSWETVLPFLPASIHAFALSQRGHGDSERPEEGYLPFDFAEDVHAFMKALNLEPAVVVGHSMGSFNAIRFAIDHPEHTRGLVLESASAAFRRNPDFVEYWQSEISPLTDPIDPDFAREFQESTLSHPLPGPFFETVVNESLKVSARVWKASFDGFMQNEFAGELHKIKATTLVIWGARDSICRREDQDTLLARIEGSRLVVYENAGHAVHWEEPERFANDLVVFVNSLLTNNEAVTPPQPAMP